jgi:hypothetical protein
MENGMKERREGSVQVRILHGSRKEGCPKEDREM